MRVRSRGQMARHFPMLKPSSLMIGNSVFTASAYPNETDKIAIKYFISPRSLARYLNPHTSTRRLSALCVLQDRALSRVVPQIVDGCCVGHASRGLHAPAWTPLSKTHGAIRC